MDVTDQPGRVLKVGDVHIQVHLSMHSTSKAMCSATTSDTLRGRFRTGSGRERPASLPTVTKVQVDAPMDLP